jgi:hypothetical protein
MHKHGQQCTELIETTANALSGGAVTLMLLTVQKDNLELNIKRSVEWYVPIYSGVKMIGGPSNHRTHHANAFRQGDGDGERVIKICLMTFPSLWVSRPLCSIMTTSEILPSSIL